MAVLRKNKLQHNEMLIALALVVIAAFNVTAAATVARSAWGQENPDRPLGALPTSAVENMVTFSKGAANKTAEHPVVPDPITVKSGSKLTFFNHDDVTHSATQGSPENGPSGFDAGVIGPGKNATVVVNGQPNESIPYFCKIHPFLRGTIQIAAAEEANGTNSTSPATSNQTQRPQQQPQLQSERQQQQVSNASSSNSTLTTFTVGGTIASLAAGSNNTANVISPYLLSGRWTLQVVDGTAKSFDANITMVNANGSDFHTHRLFNFKVADTSLSRTVIHNQTGSNATSPLQVASSQSSLSVPARVDITVDGNRTWSNVPVSVMINQLHSLYIATDEGMTGNHFTLEERFAPGVYGLVDSLKDKDGKELFQNGKINLPAG
jgi:plastocyanin